MMKLETETQLTYQREDDRVYILSDGAEELLLVPKNRDVPEAFLHPQTGPLTPAFSLLALAFLGLALAGLGTIILAPLAMLWTLYVCFTRRLDRADHIRAAIILGISAGLLGFAIPLSLLFLARLAG